LTVTYNLILAAVLSGKELFNYNASLFVDDDAAIDASEEQALSAETKADELQQEQKAKEEAERAQAEQLRLAEIERVLAEERVRRHNELRRRALDPERILLNVGGIAVNRAVFETEEDEDLEPFPEQEEGRDEEAEEEDQIFHGDTDNFESVVGEEDEEGDEEEAGDGEVEGGEGGGDLRPKGSGTDQGDDS